MGITFAIVGVGFTFEWRVHICVHYNVETVLQIRKEDGTEGKIPQYCVYTVFEGIMIKMHVNCIR